MSEDYNLGYERKSPQIAAALSALRRGLKVLSETVLVIGVVSAFDKLYIGIRQVEIWRIRRDHQY